MNAEKELLRDSLLKKQEEVIKRLDALLLEKQKKKGPLRFGSSDSAVAAAEVSNQQIHVLQAERDELRKMLEKQKMKDNMVEELSEKVNQLEELLRKEKDSVREVSREKEKLEINLLRERLSVEKQARDYSRLQEIVAKKERIEKQLESQISQEKNASQSSLNVHSSRVIAQRIILQEKKTDLVVEIRRRTCFRDMGIQTGSSYISRGAAPLPRRAPQLIAQKTRPPSVENRMLRLDCGCITELGTMKMRTGCRYHQAVEKLRRELKMQDTSHGKQNFR